MWGKCKANSHSFLAWQMVGRERSEWRGRARGEDVIQSSPLFALGREGAIMSCKRRFNCGMGLLPVIEESGQELLWGCPEIHPGKRYRCLGRGASGLGFLSCTWSCRVHPECEPWTWQGAFSTWLCQKVILETWDCSQQE